MIQIDDGDDVHWDVKKKMMHDVDLLFPFDLDIYYGQEGCGCCWYFSIFHEMK